MKATFKGKDPKLISAVEPVFYSKRFIEFVNDQVFAPHDSEQTVSILIKKDKFSNRVPPR